MAFNSTIKLTINTPWGTFAEAVQVDDHTFRETFAMQGAPHPDIPLHTFEEMVTILKRKTFRRDILKDTALRLAGQIANYLEDREGWHGEDRRESAEGRTP